MRKAKPMTDDAATSALHSFGVLCAAIAIQSHNRMQLTFTVICKPGQSTRDYAAMMKKWTEVSTAAMDAIRYFDAKVTP